VIAEAISRDSERQRQDRSRSYITSILTRDLRDIDLTIRFTKVTIAGMVGHSERSVIRKYVRAPDAYINRLPNQREFKQSAYALAAR
jgi:hypothetical protein